MCLIKKLEQHINDAHQYYFVEFAKKAYEIIYVDGNEVSRTKVEELREHYKHYLNYIFPTKVKLVKYSKTREVCEVINKFLVGTQYKITLVWKENNKILTDPSDFETWVTEV